jgi:hypothetical protein
MDVGNPDCEVTHVELVPVTSVNDMALASIIKGVLEQGGIEAFVSGSGAEDVFPTDTLDAVQVLVSEADLERALDLLDQYETSPEPEDEEE